MAFVNSPLGNNWRRVLIESINYTEISIDRWGKLKASGYDAPLVPNQIEQAIQAMISLIPDWITDPFGLAPYFFVPAEVDTQQLGQTVLSELNEIKAQLEALPDIYFEAPYQPSEPDPNNTDCQNLIDAINGIRAGASGDEIRQIVKEELSPIGLSIVNAEANIRNELLEVRIESEQIWNALHTYDSTRENPIATIDKYFELWGFPIQNIPTSFIQKKDKDGNIQPIQYRTINSWMELMEWQVKVFEELIGQFPVDINLSLFQEEVPITDENGEQILDEDGNPKTETRTNKQLLSFPNISETLAEFFPLIYQSWKNSEKCEELLVKANIEIAQIKKMAVQNSYRLQALEDYLGYPIEEDATEIPFAISIAANTVDQLSKPSKQSIDIVKYTQSSNFANSLAQLSHGAEIIKNVFWRPMPNNPDGAIARVKEIIEGQKAIQDEIDSKNIDDVDSRMEEIESGLIGKAGISDSINPYGSPYVNRPKITQIGNTSEKGSQDGI